MTILTSSLDNQLEKAYKDFEDTFGFGPCGVYAVIRREHGWGQVAACIARCEDGIEFGHYVILDRGDIIDLSNPFDEELTYSEVEPLRDDEMPDLVSRDVLDWMRARIVNYHEND